MNFSVLSPARYRENANPLRSQRRVELAVLVLALMLCAQLLYSGARLAMLSAPEPVPLAADALSVGQIIAAQGISAEQRGEIVARPLFWQSRRPQEDIAAVTRDDGAHGKVGKLKGIRLLGVFGAGETAGAIVQQEKSKKRILLGEEINGWTLESVEPNRVTFSSGGRSGALLLRARPVTAGTAGQAPVKAPPAKSGPAKAGPVNQGAAGSVSRKPAKPAPTSAGQGELSLGGSPAE